MNSGKEVNPIAVAPRVLETCPYDTNHKVSPHRFTTHLMKCHSVHVQKQAAKNQPPLFAICKHNIGHHVEVDKMEEHLRTCETGKEFDLDDWEEKFLAEPLPTPQPASENEGGWEDDEKEVTANNETDFMEILKQMVLDDKESSDDDLE